MKKTLFFLACLFGAPCLWAVSPVPYTEALSFSSRIIGTGSSTMTVYGESTVAVSDSVSASDHESSIVSVLLRPGKTYTVNFSGNGPNQYWLSFITPNTYTLYINGVPRDLIGQSGLSGSYSQNYQIELRPVVNSIRADAAAFSGISLGKAIEWNVGLGGYRNSRSAGRIQFREADLITNNPASRDRLYFSPGLSVGQNTTVYDGASSQTLRQISVPQAYVDLVDITAGYEIRFYSSTSGWNGSTGRYEFTGLTPWRTIRVESPVTNQLKITEIEGSVSHVSLLSLAAAVTQATGGSVSTSGNYTVHTFTSSGTFTVTGSLSSVETLVVAGGGGGAGLLGTMNAGGGGGGGVLYSASLPVSTGAYTVTVGAGGTSGANGGNSVFSTLTAIGGGHGASAAYAAPGAAGGSGGGEGTSQGGGAGAGTSGQGNAGSAGAGAPNYQGGGGGGAQYPGGGVYGGWGVSNSISGTATYYGGGGGGGSNAAVVSSGSGIYGGGGDGGGSNRYNGLNGTANTGGGGGGSAQWSSTGGTGGSGIVIIRYPSVGSVASGNYGWILQEGDGTTWLRTTTHTSTIPTAGQRDDVVVVRTGGTSGTIVAKTKYHYVTQPWNAEEVTQIVADPDSAALTTTYAYNTTSTAYGNYRKVMSVQSPTGNWVSYAYYDDWNRRGQVQVESRPFQDSPSTVTAAASSVGNSIVHDYAPDFTGRYRIESSRLTYVTNVLAGKTITTPTINQAQDGQIYTIYQTDAYASASVAQRTISNIVDDGNGSNNPDYYGQTFAVMQPDLSQSSLSHYYGSYNYSTKVFTSPGDLSHFRSIEWHGSSSSAGADSYTTYDGLTVKQVYLIPNKSTKDVTIRNPAGLIVRTEKHVYTGSGNFTLLSSVDNTYDFAGRLTQSVASNGATTTNTFVNGQLTSSIDATGIETQFTYDLLGRVATSVKKGAPAIGSADITTTYTLDGANNIIQAVTASGSLSQTSSSSYDLAGRITQKVAPGGYTTGYSYSAGGRIVTTTLPGYGTKITENFLDGQLKNVTGTGVINEFLSYLVDGSTGQIYSQHRFASGTSGAWENKYTDWLGRQVQDWKPGWSGTNVGRLWYYNSYGQLYKYSQPGLADTLYTYDTLGQLVLEGLDINGNGTLDLASDDRITGHAYGIYTFDSGVTWWRQVINSTYATSGGSTSTATDWSETKLFGFTGTLRAQTNSHDQFGNTTFTTVDVDPTNKKVTTTTDTPDSNINAVQIAYNGLTTSSTDATGVTVTYGYDALGRQTTSVDPRTGTTTTSYVSGTNLVSSVTDPASVAQATYTYDASGRVATVTNGLGKVARYEYTTLGQKLHEWGDTAYPVEYVYDAYGRQTQMKTYRGGSGWTNSTWASITPGTADVTTWNFDDPTGFLASKTDATSHSVSYTYTQAGQIATRTWARGVVTTYAYSATTGELTGVSYSDSTTAVGYTYNRLGKPATVSDWTGTRTFTYNLGGTLELQREDLPSFLGSRRITYGYDTASGTVGRPNALQLGTSGSPTADENITYAYDASGRFNSLAGGGQTFGYTYASNSHLVSVVTDTAVGYTDTRVYDPYHDWVDSRTTSVSSVTKAAFAYTQDNIGRITQTAKTGAVFASYGNGTDGLKTNYGYDDRSEVTSEQTKVGTTSTTLTGRDDTHAYDTFGNRATVTHNGNTATYTTNALNQYTQRTVPGIFDVAGASTGTTVTVSRSGGSTDTAARHGNYFFDGYSLANNPNDIYTTLTVADGTTSANVPAFLAGTPESPTYDNDGNLTADGRWSYSYDGENRLTQIQTTTPAQTAGVPRQLLQFYYDYLGRRSLKLLYHYVTGTGWVLDYGRSYVYNGWNPMEEIDYSTGSVINKFFWGLDLSGAMQAAGGVGGLLMTQDSSNSYLPIYSGNGDVYGLIKASDGSLAATYEYDAFGNTLRESGSYADSNFFRYSTKYTDIETGLTYYGQRYYSPSLGRFINKDPIEEKGGLNLYGFCLNNGVNHVDYLGNDPMVHVMFGVSHPEWSDAQYAENMQLNAHYGVAQDAGSFSGFLGSGGENSLDENGLDTTLLMTAAGDYAAAYNAKHPPPPPPPNTITLVNKSSGQSLNVVIPGASQDAINVGVMAAQMTADTFDYGSGGSPTALASNSGGMYSDGSIPFVTNGGEAKSDGKAGPINPPAGMLIYHGTPPGSQAFTLPNGQTFLAPAGTDFNAVYAAGKANGTSKIAMNDAEGHWGTFDFQRNGGQGNLGDSRNVFYTQYTNASNYGVGVYMNGAGYSLSDALDTAATFASLFSSNAGSPAQARWQGRGWYAAQRGAPNGKSP